MNTSYYAGIDYHKFYSTVCVMDADRKVVLEATVRPNGKEEFHRGTLEGQPVHCII